MLLFALSACAAHADDPQAIADRITRAVYANDIAGTTADFDDATKRTISRAQVGALSDRMHALGPYASLSPRTAHPDSGKYSYDAHFANGTMLVQLRIDPSGRVGAYRVSPENAAATR